MVSKIVCKECGSVTLRLSWSQLRNHEECKQKGYLSRTRKRATLANTRNFFPGTVTDRVVRDWLLREDKEPGQMPLMVEEIMAREERFITEGDPTSGHDPEGQLVWRDSQDKKRVLEECKEAAKLIEPSLMKYVVPFEYEVDKRFKAPLDIPHPAGGTETVILIGAMDILVRDNRGRYWIFDVKHTRDDYYWRKTIGQLTYYDLAVELMYGEPAAGSALFQPLCKKPEHPHKATAQARSELQQRLVMFASDIWREDRAPKKNRAGCGFCDYKHACEAFQPVIDRSGNKRVSF